MQDQLDMKPDARTLLRDAFGFDTFRPGQEAVVAALLAGRSALAVFPTGAGKSLCYQLPALALDGLTLVVSPLIALMKDQVDALRARGIAAARLDSSLASAEARELYRQIGDGEVRILYVAPERLTNEGFLNRLRRVPIALLAIDEAHCISEWGHNFRPDYLKLADFARDHSVGRVLALTATATPAVSADVRRAFGIAEVDHVQTGFRRPNLALRITPCGPRERRGLLADRLRAQGGGATVVYVTLQHTAEDVATFLVSQGFAARAYHAGLKPDLRSEIQEAFMADRCQIVVATIAFGMGIDKANIRAVYHYNLPKSLENYAQEIGRAGRDGEPAACEVLACGDDTVVLGNFTYGDTPTPEAIEGVIGELFGQSKTFSISRYHVAQRNDVRSLVLSTLLTYLELDGALRQTGPYYSGYQYQLLATPQAILDAYPARREFLESVFGDAKRGRVWASIEPVETAERIGEPRDRIVKALQHLEEQGELTLRPSGLRHGYERCLELPIDREGLAADLAARFREREARDAERLATVVAFCEDDGCLTGRLLGYFGEDLAGGCGTCARCEGAPGIELPRSEPLTLGAAEEELVRALRAEKHKALHSPRQLARFLCGLSSPATTQAKLRKHERWGWLSPVEFPRVLALVEGTR